MVLLYLSQHLKSNCSLLVTFSEMVLVLGNDVHKSWHLVSDGYEEVE